MYSADGEVGADDGPTTLHNCVIPSAATSADGEAGDCIGIPDGGSGADGEAGILVELEADTA